MLLVKTKLQQSPISGIGLFADEIIKKGTIVWKYNPVIDILLNKIQIDELPVVVQKQVNNYAYFDNVFNGYVLCGDDARFFNHSDNPNCDDTPPSEVTIAVCDIMPGEELTCNYKTFYGDITNHPEIQ